jgi:acrylyl-CoA reductase (NADPH)
MELRQQAWRRLETELDRGKIAAMTSEVELANVIETGTRIIDGQVRGRIVVKVR